jgi:dTDP-4-amino-4,6-dideoxygalactose transaminase
LSKIGSCKGSKAAIFSFHGIKHVAMGEGGCVTTNDPILTEKILEKRNHGILRDKDKFIYNPEPVAPWYYEMKEIGWNYRVDETSCALGLSQFKRLQKNIDKRRKIVDLYNKAFLNNDFINTPKVKNNSLSYVWHLYSLNIDFNACKSSRGRVMDNLLKKGIQTQVHYIPLFLQPYYRLTDIGQFIGSMEYYNNTLSIPLYSQLNEEDINFISSTINKVVSL